MNSIKVALESTGESRDVEIWTRFPVPNSSLSALLSLWAPWPQERPWALLESQERELL